MKVFTTRLLLVGPGLTQAEGITVLGESTGKPSCKSLKVKALILSLYGPPNEQQRALLIP
jgi:hypothetical protein